MLPLPFRDRSEAGRLLAAELASREYANPIVLALPRGGVPLAEAVARKLKAPLDVVVVRKLGVPWQPELAMGALAGTLAGTPTGTTQVLDHAILDHFRISNQDVDEVIVRETSEMERRERLYRGSRPAPVLKDRNVILVDDGLATGSSMLAAVRHVRAAQPRKVIVAVPVASAQACRRFHQEADECICLATPEPFYAVGEWYEDFRQVTDQEVQQALTQAT